MHKTHKTPTKIDLLEYLQFSESLTDSTIGPILSYFRSKLLVEDKADQSPVTLADRQTEWMIREQIQSLYPEHGIIGEEHGSLNPESSWQWVLDPIDGTSAFISGSPLFGTLIGLMYEKNPQIGVINVPVTGERWSAMSGGHCKYKNQNSNHEICRVSGNEDLSKALMHSTDPSMFNDLQSPRVQQLIQQVKMHRYGGDCYLYGMLSCGWIDLVVEADMKLYDTMALIPIVQSSGGLISDWQGKPIQPGWDGTVIAAGSNTLHKQAINILFYKTESN